MRRLNYRNDIDARAVGENDAVHQDNYAALDRALIRHITQFCIRSRETAIWEP